MPDDEARRWAEMAGTADTVTTTYDAPPAQASAAPPLPARDSGKKEKKAKKEKRQKPPRAPSASRTREPAMGPADDIPLLDLKGETRSREQLMQAGAEDLMQALAGSYSLLHAEVPDSASPDDAQRKIEQQLGKYDADIDAELPGHPIYQGDTLVYYQLRRHYGMVQPGNTQGRTGGLLRKAESIRRSFTAADERGNRYR